MGLFNKDKPENTNTTNAQPASPQEQQSTEAPARRVAMSSAELLHKEAVITPQEAADIYNVPKMMNDVNFSDLYITPDKKSYVWSGKSEHGLRLANFIDLPEFISAVIEKYDGTSSSYSLRFKNRNYRIERTVALEGEQFCARKMPASVPDLDKLGFPTGVSKHLIALTPKRGLVLLAGATGSGKSTTISALIKKYLQVEGGYAFTIEDPIEMPLDGVYQTINGDLGICKQTTPPNGIWEDGIKSALRSKPRYIYLGEIRSPESAVELLRAATSGHLVFSTIHANNVTDAINALAKYAAASGISEELAYELTANGFLACLHQRLVGTPPQLKIETLFANPDINATCQVRSMIRTGRLNFATILEAQKNKLERGIPLFSPSAEDELK